MFNSLTTLVRTRKYLVYFYRDVRSCDPLKVHSFRMEVDQSFDPQKDFHPDEVHAFAWYMEEVSEYSVIAPSLHLEHNFSISKSGELYFEHSDVLDEDSAWHWVKMHDNNYAVSMLQKSISLWKSKREEPKFIFDRYNEPFLVSRETLQSLYPLIKG